MAVKRIVTISDTHSLHWKMKHDLPDGDLFIYAGDLCNSGGLSEVEDFALWLNSIKDKFRHRVVICGNHCWAFQNYPLAAKQYIKDTGSVYLENEYVIIDGIKIYGSPVSPTFCNWAFNIDRGEPIAKYWANIPDDTDILITHGPVQGILDLTYYDKKHVGCEELKKTIDTRLKNLKVHIGGHIHIHNGHIPQHTSLNGLLYINASICNENYDPVNKPVSFDIDVKTKKVTKLV